MLARSPHLRVIALVIGLAAGGAAIVEQQVNMVAEATGASEDGITAFLANITMYLSLAGFVVQIGLTSRIHRSLGLAFALLLLPLTLGSSAAIVLLTGAVWAPQIARVLDSTLRYTVDKTTREILFLPLPADIKYRAKPFIDVTMDRFAKALVAIVLLVLVQPWGLDLDWRELSYASLALTGDLGRRHAGGAARVPVVVPPQHRRPDACARRHPRRRRRRRHHRDARRGAVQPRRAGGALRDHDARGARQAQPDHAAAAAARVAAGAAAGADGARLDAVPHRPEMDAGHRADDAGRRRRRARGGAAGAGRARARGRVGADAPPSRRPRAARGRRGRHRAGQQRRSGRRRGGGGGAAAADRRSSGTPRWRAAWSAPPRSRTSTTRSSARCSSRCSTSTTPRVVRRRSAAPA